MTTGILVAALSMLILMLGGASGWIVALAVVIFSIGEMLTSPKSQEYIAFIAPKDKVATYMGYYFVAVALGNLFGGLLSGALYGHLARDLRQPNTMWMIFTIIGVCVAFLFVLYNRFILHPLKTDLPRHEAHIVHAEDGEDVPEMPEME